MDNLFAAIGILSPLPIANSSYVQITSATEYSRLQIIMILNHYVRQNTIAET